MNNNKEEIKEFQNYLVAEAKSQNKDPKLYVKELGEDGLKAAYERFQNNKKKKALKALHGAKLNYFKSLKNQCAEDEEVVYYKKGGSVTCGCKKKDGGEVVTARSGSAVEKFKQIKKGKFGVTALADATGSQGGFKKAEKKKLEYNKSGNNKPVTNVATQDKNPGSTKQPMQEAEERARHKNNYNNLKKGGEVKKDCGGSAIANFKMKCGYKVKKHQYGAPLNISANDVYGGWNLIKNAGSRLWDLMNRNITNNPDIIIGEPNFLPGRGAGNIGKVVGAIKKLPSNARGAIRMYKGKPTNILLKKVDWAKDADIRKSMDLGYDSKLAGRIDYSE